MPLEGSYAIWNNRGGTGKTTLTYHLANKYAVKHPDKTILLIDMCPQADLSHAFLGDDENNLDYVSQIGTLKKDSMMIGDQRVPKTVSGYLDIYTSIGLPQNVDPRTFLTNVSKFNPLLPRNLYLLCGDASIELIARSLEIKRNSSILNNAFGTNAWKAVTTALKHFIRKIAERKGIKLVVFIDTNSVFSIITEIALCAADKLLIPINDEHLHRNGFEYMFALLYGFSQPSNVYYYYRHLSLYYRANEFDVKLPKIHLIINKLTKNNSINSNNNNLKTLTNGDNNNNNYTKPDSELRWEFIFDLLKKFPQVFHLRNNERIPETIEEFKNEYLIEIGFEQATTNIVREAVRSHSPLLTVKNPHNIRPIIAVANTSTTPSSTTTSGYSSIQQTPSSSTSSSASSNSSSQNNTKNISSNHKITATYPCPTRLIVTNSDANQQIIIKKNNDDVNNNNNNSNNIEFSNAIMFDKILDKIVDRL
jgi:cellulose biosynthesis protein BcsQ